jgi:hypothetical protein
MIFMVIFDIIYLIVWIFSFEMNIVKALIVAGLTVLLTPWARVIDFESGRKVVIKSLVLVMYKKLHRNKIN